MIVNGEILQAIGYLFHCIGWKIVPQSVWNWRTDSKELFTENWCQRIDLLGSAKRCQTGGFSRFSSMVWKQSYVTRNKKMCLPMGQVNTYWKSRLGIHNKKSAKICLSWEKCSFLNLWGTPMFSSGSYISTNYQILYKDTSWKQWIRTGKIRKVS